MEKGAGARRQSKLTLISIPLPLQLILRRVLDRHITSIHAEPGRRRRRRQVIVRRPTVPEHEISGLRAHLDPFAAVARQPFQPGGREAVPFRVPRRDGRLPRHLLVELYAEFVPASADDQAAVVGAVGEEID